MNKITQGPGVYGAKTRRVKDNHLADLAAETNGTRFSPALFCWLSTNICRLTRQLSSAGCPVHVELFKHQDADKNLKAFFHLGEAVSELVPCRYPMDLSIAHRPLDSTNAYQSRLSAMFGLCLRMARAIWHLWPANSKACHQIDMLEPMRQH